MNCDKLKFWFSVLLFPFVYFGLAAVYSYYHVYALGTYQPKALQWGMFLKALGVTEVTSVLASVSYGMSLNWLKSEVRQLPHSRLALITLVSVLLSWAVWWAIMTFGLGIALPLFLFGGVCLFPALIGASAIRIHRRSFARRQLTQR